MNVELEARVLTTPLRRKVLWGELHFIFNALGEVIENFLTIRIDQNFGYLCLQLLIRVDTTFEFVKASIIYVPITDCAPTSAFELGLLVSYSLDIVYQLRELIFIFFQNFAR